MNKLIERLKAVAEAEPQYKHIIDKTVETLELCEDAISRQATLDAIIKLLGIKNEAYLLEAERAVYQRILAMPSVTSKPQIGWWIPIEYDGYADGNPVWDKWECSECGWEHSGDEESLTTYCPNCGSRMEVEQ